MFGRYEGCSGAGSCGCCRGFAACVTAADNDDIVGSEAVLEKCEYRVSAREAGVL